MASNGTTESHVKVGENRDFTDDYSASNGEGDAGEATKRRRVTHDYRKLSKLGYDPSVSTNVKHGQSIELKGISHTYLLIVHQHKFLSFIPLHQTVDFIDYYHEILVGNVLTLLFSYIIEMEVRCVYKHSQYVKDGLSVPTSLWNP